MTVCDVYVIVRNEEQLLPLFLRHYSFARNIIIYDDRSTDRTLAIAYADPRVKVRHIDFGGFAEDRMLDLRNTCYRGSDADWVIVVDIDEFVYHPDLLGQLGNYKTRGITVPIVKGFEMVSNDGVPHEGQITDSIKYGVLSQLYSKQAVFDPRIDIQYTTGCHGCHPVGPVFRGGSLQLLHCHFLGVDWVVERWRQRRLRVDPRAGALSWKRYDLTEAELREHVAALTREAVQVVA